MEEDKKMKCYKRLLSKQFSRSQVFVAHSLFVKTLHAPLYSFLWRGHIGVQFWCTNMAAGNQQKYLEFLFSIKALSFHSRTRIRAHKNTF